MVKTINDSDLGDHVLNLLRKLGVRSSSPHFDESDVEVELEFMGARVTPIAGKTFPTYVEPTFTWGRYGIETRVDREGVLHTSIYRTGGSQKPLFKVQTSDGIKGCYTVVIKDR